MLNKIMRKGLAVVLAFSLIAPTTYGPEVISNAKKMNQEKSVQDDDSSRDISQSASGSSVNTDSSNVSDSDDTDIIGTYHESGGWEPENDQIILPDYSAKTRGDSWGSSSYDSNYTNISCQSAPRDQGNNGLCWAFASLGLAEANLRKTTGKSEDFSEANMGYCTYAGSDNSLKGWESRDYPGAGGNLYMASSYLMRGNLSGTVDEQYDSYSTERLQSRPISRSSYVNNYKVNNIYYLTKGSRVTRNSSEMDVIKGCIQSYGGVAARMCMPNTSSVLNQYYNSTYAAFYSNEALSNDYGHIVEIVGWDDNFSYTKFKSGRRPSNNGAWYVRNSWGSSWGSGGYFWVSYDDVNFPTWAFTIDGLREVTYDESGYCEEFYENDYKYNGGSWGWESEDSVYFIKMFDVDCKSSFIKEVKVFVPVANRYIDVDINTGCYGTKESDRYILDDNYTFSSKKRIRVTYPGWYTVKFDKPIELYSFGFHPFAVVVKMSTIDGENGELWMGYADPNHVERSFGDVYGDTYYTHSSSGKVWYAALSNSNYVNFCIKAVSDPSIQPPLGYAKPWSIEIDSAANNDYCQVRMGTNGTWYDYPHTYTGLTPDTDYVLYSRFKTWTTRTSVGITCRTSKVYLSDAQITVSPSSGITYSGSQIKPEVSVVVDGHTIPSSQYTVSYGTNTDAGTNAGSVTVTAKSDGYCLGSKTAYFTINPYNVSGFTEGVNYSVPSVVYTGTSYEPDYSFSFNGRTLSSSDITKVFTQPISGVGSGTLTITGRGNFTGTKTVPFSVTQELLTDSMYTVSGTENNGWYRGTVSIRPNTSTLYRLYKQGDSSYSSSISVTAEGKNSVSFYLRDRTTDAKYLVSSNRNTLGTPKTLEIKIDKSAPKGSIQVGLNSDWSDPWSTFRNVSITENPLLRNLEDKIKITASDTKAGVTDTSGVDEISYYISTSSYSSTSQLANLSESNWHEYDDENRPSFPVDSTRIVYARIKDVAGNTTYLASDRIQNDMTEPTIGNPSVADSDISQNSAKVVASATDGGSGIDKYKFAISESSINDSTVKNSTKSSTTGSYTFTGLTANKTYYFGVVAYDKAGNVSIVKKGSFRTKKSNIAGAAITLSSDSFEYNGDSQMPTTTVKVNGVTLTRNTDYTCEVASEAGKSNGTNAGTVKLLFTGMGEYGGTNSTTYTITPITLTASIEGSTTKQYDRTGSCDGTGLSLSLNGVLAGDSGDVVATAGTYAYTSPNAGENVEVSASGITLSGTKASNYQMATTPVKANVGSITRATPTLTVTQTTYNKKTNDSSFSIAGSNISYSGDGALSYVSSDPSVATVNSSGVVTIKKAGDTQITISGSAGNNYVALPVADNKMIQIHITQASTSPGNSGGGGGGGSSGGGGGSSGGGGGSSGGGGGSSGGGGGSSGGGGGASGGGDAGDESNIPKSPMPSASASPTPIPSASALPTAAPSEAPTIAPTIAPTESPAAVPDIPKVPTVSGEPEKPTASPDTTNVEIVNNKDEAGNIVSVQTTVNSSWADGTTEKTVLYEYPDGSSLVDQIVTRPDIETVETELKTNINGDSFAVIVTTPVSGENITITTVETKKKITQVKDFLVVGKNELQLLSMATNSTKESLSVPKTVVAKGITYKVTSIKKKAFKGRKKLSTLVISEYIKSIGDEAFSGDKKLVSILIRAKKLSYVGKKAFSGISKKAVFSIYGTKKQFNTIVKLLKGSGVGKSVKFKRVKK